MGFFACAVAIAGLVSSIVRGNESAVGSNTVPIALQRTLLGLALLLGFGTLAKWWQAKRTGKL